MRCVVRIILLLFAGALLTLAIAWASELWAPIPWPRVTPTSLPMKSWTHSATVGWPAKPEFGGTADTLLLTEIDLCAQQTEGVVPSRVVTGEWTETVWQSGFPFRSMESCLRTDSTRSPGRGSSFVGIGYRPGIFPLLQGPRKNEGILSSTPIWRGFVADTIVYTALAWALLPSTWRLAGSPRAMFALWVFAHGAWKRKRQPSAMS